MVWLWRWVSYSKVLEAAPCCSFHLQVPRGTDWYDKKSNFYSIIDFLQAILNRDLCNIFSSPKYSYHSKIYFSIPIVNVENI